MQQKLTCSPISGIFRGNCRETQLTCLDLDTCNHEIIDLKFLKIGKFHRALWGPVGRPVPTPFSIVVNGLEKRRTTAGRSVRSYLQDGRTGRFGTLPLRKRTWARGENTYLGGKWSNTTSQIITVEHRCRILLRKENKRAMKILLGRDEASLQKLATEGRTSQVCTKFVPSRNSGPVAALRCQNPRSHTRSNSSGESGLCEIGDLREVLAGILAKFKQTSAINFLMM